MALPTLSSDLKKVDDVALSHILATQSVLFKSSEFPSVTLIQSWDEISECGGSFESCPNARLFVIVTTGDLYEAPLLYELPPSKGWEYVKSSKNEKQLTIFVKTTLNHANVSRESRTKWVSNSYKISVSKNNGLVTLSQ